VIWMPSRGRVANRARRPPARLAACGNGVDPANAPRLASILPRIVRTAPDHPIPPSDAGKCARRPTDGRNRRFVVIAATCTGQQCSRMQVQRRIGFLAFDGIQALDLVGPADAFGSDVFAPPSCGAGDPVPYTISIIGLRSRNFVSSSGVPMRATNDAGDDIELDTLIVPGGRGLRENGMGLRAAEWIRQRAPDIRRIATVCTGIYGLAPSGLLDGRTVTTHWAAAADVAARFPRLKLDPDKIFIRSGKYYTSAGVSAGIDLALALIEEDQGSATALAVAREMVVYMKRPGGQKQFSEPLEFQVQATDQFKELIVWIGSHLNSDLTNERLAAGVNLSPRQFSRTFKREFEITPAAFVERARLSAAARRIVSASTRLDIAAVARSVGYASEDVFRRAFERRFGVSPSRYRSHFHE
jgi:transcriptional regulator GlxA family with amidase domain